MNSKQNVSRLRLDAGAMFALPICLFAASCANRSDQMSAKSDAPESPVEQVAFYHVPFT